MNFSRVFLVIIMIGAHSIVGCGDSSSAEESTTLALSTISPRSGSTAGGDKVTLGGTYLTSVSEVLFGGQACVIDGTPTNTVLRCVAPAHAAGTVDVVVKNSMGSDFTYQSGFSFH